MRSSLEAKAFDLFYRGSASKRAQSLAERLLDFDDVKFVFEALHFETEDLRKEYG